MDVHHLVKRERETQSDSDTMEVCVGNPQIAKDQHSKSAITNLNSLEVLRQLDLDSVIEPLEENGNVPRYLDRFCDVMSKDTRFSDPLAIFILKTRLPRPIVKFIIEIERSKSDATLKDVIDEIRKSQFCTKELTSAKETIFFHKFQHGMDPQEYLNTITEAIFTIVPDAPDILRSFTIINLLPEGIKRHALKNLNTNTTVDDILNILVKETVSQQNGPNNVKSIENPGLVVTNMNETHFESDSKDSIKVFYYLNY